MCRNNLGLIEIAKKFKELNIPIKYNKKEDVLQKPHIQWIIKILEFVNSVSNSREEEADYLLPEILSYPFFQLSRLTLYQISLKAWQKRTVQKEFKKQAEIALKSLKPDSQNLEKQNQSLKIDENLNTFEIQKVTWLSTMLEWPEESKVRQIALYLLELAFLAKYSTAEKVIDKILGIELENQPDVFDPNEEIYRDLPEYDQDYSD